MEQIGKYVHKYVKFKQNSCKNKYNIHHETEIQRSQKTFTFFLFYEAW